MGVVGCAKIAATILLAQPLLPGWLQLLPHLLPLPRVQNCPITFLLCSVPPLCPGSPLPLLYLSLASSTLPSIFFFHAVSCFLESCYPGPPQSPVFPSLPPAQAPCLFCSSVPCVPFILYKCCFWKGFLVLPSAMDSFSTPFFRHFLAPPFPRLPPYPHYMSFFHALVFLYSILLDYLVQKKLTDLTFKEDSVNSFTYFSYYGHNCFSCVQHTHLTSLQS